MIALAFIAALCVVCSAQLPAPCESPKQWTGVRTLVDPSKHFLEKSRVAYDEENMRTRFTEEIEQGKERDIYDVLHLYAMKKEYRMNMKTKQCNVTTLTRSMRQVGVPMNATYLYSAEIGPVQIPLEHLTVAVFAGNYTEDNVKYMSYVTTPGCIPVMDRYSNSITGYIESHYFDIKVGAIPADRFTPPPECTKDEEY